MKVGTIKDIARIANVFGNDIFVYHAQMRCLGFRGTAMVIFNYDNEISCIPNVKFINLNALKHILKQYKNMPYDMNKEIPDVVFEPDGKYCPKPPEIEFGPVLQISRKLLRKLVTHSRDSKYFQFKFPEEEHYCEIRDDKNFLSDIYFSGCYPRTYSFEYHTSQLYDILRTVPAHVKELSLRFVPISGIPSMIKFMELSIDDEYPLEISFSMARYDNINTEIIVTPLMKKYLGI